MRTTYDDDGGGDDEDAWGDDDNGEHLGWKECTRKLVLHLVFPKIATPLIGWKKGGLKCFQELKTNNNNSLLTELTEVSFKFHSLEGIS